MKSFTPLFILLFTIQLGAQSIILLEQDSVAGIYEDVDISGGFENFALDLFFKNNTNEPISVNWRRKFSPNCPFAWEVVTADQFLTYTPDVNESQVPMMLSPLDSHIIIRQLFWPNSVAGCCDVRVVFSLDGTPETPIDTGYYHIAINSNECGVSPIIEQENKTFNIYPNPASNVLYLENGHLIESVDIMDAAGKTRMQNIEPNSNKMDISTLPPGLYYLKIKGNSGDEVVRKMIKQ